MAKKKSMMKQAKKQFKQSGKSSEKLVAKVRTEKIRKEAGKAVAGELASVAKKISTVIKKSHVKESFNGSVHDAEKFLKHVLDDNESLKKFVKIVRKSFSKNAKHKSAAR